MDVRIGVVHTPKELTVEFEGSETDITKAVEAALGGTAPVLWLTDVKGRRVGVPADKIAYVEIDTDGAAKRVGFGP
jgi:DNA-binding MurR/RpiR family transcriptional regulator